MELLTGVTVLRGRQGLRATGGRCGFSLCQVARHILGTRCRGKEDIVFVLEELPFWSENVPPRGEQVSGHQSLQGDSSEVLSDTLLDSVRQACSSGRRNSKTAQLIEKNFP